MQAALDLFRENIQRSRNLTAVFRAIDSQTTDVLDLSDILRASLVMTVSTLDHFVHELARLGMLEAYRGDRVRTASFLRFQVTLESVLETSSISELEVWLESEIRERHGFLSFQMPDRIADAIRLISDVPLWNGVANEMSMERQAVVETLTLIVQRRNKIAHEADIMVDHAGQTVYSDLRSPIDETIVENAIDFVDQIGRSVYQLVKLPPQ